MSEAAPGMSSETMYIIGLGVSLVILMTIMYFILNSKINRVKSEVERECLDMRTIVNRQNQILEQVIGISRPRAPAPRPPPPASQPTAPAPKAPTKAPVCDPVKETCTVEEINDDDLDKALQEELNNVEQPESNVELQPINDDDVEIELDDI